MTLREIRSSCGSLRFQTSKARFQSSSEIYIDDSFKGKAPATFELKQGRHYVRMFMAAYKNWSQQISVVGGSELKLAATLEKSQ
jgi:PEGA domain